MTIFNVAGVPKSKRGDVWMYMADNFRVRNLPFDSTHFPNYDVTYDSLLKQLTSHQHAILIDLGEQLITILLLKK